MAAPAPQKHWAVLRMPHSAGGLIHDNCGSWRSTEIHLRKKPLLLFIPSATHRFHTSNKFHRRFSLSTKDDFWALGVTLMYFATGQFPWDRPTASDRSFSVWMYAPMSLPWFHNLYVTDRPFLRPRFCITSKNFNGAKQLIP
uniref:Protein kinase domain-containing protein n=1 Tax=Steinernema glaseri TaxID=37863 RepID=A0A1I7ZWW7_9BILA